MPYIVKFARRYLAKRSDGTIAFEDDAGAPVPKRRALTFATEDEAKAEAYRRDRYYGDTTDVEVLKVE